MSGSAVRDHEDEAAHDGRFSGPYRGLNSPVGLSTTQGVPLAIQGSTSKYISGGEDTAGDQCCATTLVACTPPIGCHQQPLKEILPEEGSKGIIISCKCSPERRSIALCIIFSNAKDAILAGATKLLLHIERQQYCTIDELVRRAPLLLRVLYCRAYLV
ncbi:hypothetical protein PpBr36_00990 [Pyricularia pennisetigena]|uniref:hypothetical protein n=1 Tax=Pyricularia pennisetigena TaxID=1578925 RepID=UPI00114F8F8E|nr:hypothetical protein PpBr36_00990 [Pyricularia pennisetigena]TLS27804.1 hypothetical protein PpBr36_00990 [Pyricularia pennisetigena]